MKRSGTLSAKEADRILGTILGFPPKAVDFYVRMMEEERKGNIEEYRRMRGRKIGLIYCGCSFVTDIEDFEINALWLLDKYPYEEAKEDGMYIRLDGERIRVPTESCRQLAEFHESIRKNAVRCWYNCLFRLLFFCVHAKQSLAVVSRIQMVCA
ncbi:hypothetical protein L2649_02540 [Thermoactinomyces vulgaris]|uniref:Uncharacterized protein n=1 Tax=Thermoactinomyces vulgaris TaxID=2026 RepID=A0ABS0QEF9_THEVU|nr:MULTISPECIES: hypothetical protein [Thermoactinomyces]KYQ87588.1 hypothetical protein AYX07_02550 [Thermoactinomyces sp. AS95]MBA4551235.1 hypothetical protein [Thermoactinomyces vulgaris]MBA4595554.1 hypothetical protein [Thermoactinomyces vulgaris]MBH8587661.1 hypothetical protein [Thermoactinomyces vulgaris]MBI0390793.1 hypothetical protein [Thermoactinomyces sp. CICC 24226]